ncbi:hydrogenase maturation nickel metallochaperone HypA [bacterium]|nr:hydrogenase maturation nickel metallochaperone HypA [bacterium]
MHELSIAEQILDIANEYTGREGVTAVKEIELEIGTLSGIEIDALTFALDAVKKDTVLHAAKVTIIDVPAKARCEDCGEVFLLEDFFSPCPSCAAFHTETIQGQELRVKSLIVDE